MQLFLPKIKHYLMVKMILSFIIHVNNVKLYSVTHECMGSAILRYFGDNLSLMMYWEQIDCQLNTNIGEKIRLNLVKYELSVNNYCNNIKVYSLPYRLEKLCFIW